MSETGGVTEVYAVEFKGDDLIISGFGRIQKASDDTHGALGRATESSTSKTHSLIEKMEMGGRTLQGMSRDVDLFGGQFSATMLKAGNDALGVAAAVGTGGLTAAVAIASIAVGRLTEMWADEQKATEDAARKLHEEADKFEKDVDKILKRRAGLTEDEYNRSSAGLELVKKEKEEVQSLIDGEGIRFKMASERIQREREAGQKQGLGRAEIEVLLQTSGATKEAKEASEGYEKAKERLLVITDKLRETEGEHKKLGHDLAQQDKERGDAVDKLNKATEEKKKHDEDEKARKAYQIKQWQDENDAVAAYWETRRKWDEQLVREGEHLERWTESMGQASNNMEELNAVVGQANQMSKDYASTLIDAEQAQESHSLKMATIRKGGTDKERLAWKVSNAERMADLAVQRIELEAHYRQQAIDEQNIDGDMKQTLLQTDKQVTEQKIANARRAGIATVAELRAEAEASAQLVRQRQMEVAVNVVYDASNMVVSAGVGVLTSKMQKLGEVNRDNLHDMMTLSDNTKAAWAAEAQAAAASLAAQATGKAAMEVGDAVKEVALGTGDLGLSLMGDPSAGAAAEAHYQSAATHAVAAAAYGVIGGGSAAVALGIGMQRGSGGAVGLTTQEQQRQGGGGGGGSTSSTGGVSAGNIGSNTGPGVSQQITINENYSGVTVGGSNLPRAAMALARVQQAVARNRFLQ